MKKKYRIVYGVNAIISMRVLQKYMEDKYYNLYKNTGLGEVEDIIINDHLLTINNFLKLLQKTINRKIGNSILGRNILYLSDEVERSKFIIFVNSYSITMYCTKYLKEGIIVIDDIVIKT